MLDGVFNLESVQVNCKRVVLDTSCISCANAMHTLLSVYAMKCVWWWCQPAAVDLTPLFSGEIRALNILSTLTCFRKDLDFPLILKHA